MPKTKLTEKSLASLKLPELGSNRDPRVTYWDTELNGFGVTVGPRGKVFVARRWVGAKKRKLTIGVAGQPREDGLPWTVMLARKRAAELIGQMVAGHDPVEEAAEEARSIGPTLADGLKLHTSNMRKKSRSVRSIATIEDEVSRYLAEWTDRPMVDLRGVDLVEMHDQVTSEGKTFLANRIVAHVSAIFNSLDRVHELAGRNPARAVVRNPYEPKRERIDDADLPAWYIKVQTLSPIRRDWQLFVLFTGMRSEAARHARWEHIDWKRKALRVPNPKGGAKRAFELPLCKTIVATLRKRKEGNAIEMAPYDGDDGWCFPSLSRSKPYKVQPLAEPKERRKNDDTGESELYLPGPHVLRRTYLSVAAEAGVSELDRHALANHAFGRQSVNATYISQAFPHLAIEQAKIEAALWKRLKTKPAKKAKGAKRAR